MKRVKIGVVGCGAIAKVHHMPNLLELQDEFEFTAVCDISPGAAAYVANRFRVPHHFADYRDMLGEGIDAVLLCHSDPKTEITFASLSAGKHTL
jgi:predicted dehydrogenase